MQTHTLTPAVIAQFGIDCNSQTKCCKI